MKTLKTTLFILLLAVVSAAPAMAGNGNSNETQIRNVSGFNAIDVATGIDLYITMGSSEEVKIVADDDIINDIKTEVKDGTLRIYMKRNNWFNWGGNRTRKAFVTVKELNKLHASSGSDVKSENLLEGESLEVSASSGSDIEIEVKYKNFSIDASSGSDAEIKGKVKYLTAEASSGSDIDASELESVNCKVNASSGSDISINVSEELVAHASSGADIVYYGNPKMRDIDESSGGDVSRR